MSEPDPSNTAETVQPEVLREISIPEETVSLQSQDDLVLFCAALAHEVNRAYCSTLNEPMLPWQKAPQWQVDSCVAGIKKVLENPKITPAELHAAWMEHKIKDGWVYGATKDDKAKTHPCLLPYDALPQSQRIKDVLYRAVVTTFFGL